MGNADKNITMHLRLVTDSFKKGINEAQRKIKTFSKNSINELKKDIADYERRLGQLSKKKYKSDTSAWAIKNRAEMDLLAGKINGAKTALAGFEKSSISSWNSLKSGLISGAATGGVFLLGQAIFQAAGAMEQFAKESSQISIQFDSITNKLRAASGSVFEGAESFDYIRNLTNKFGLSLLETADAFSLFQASALRSNISMDETKQIFEDVSTAVVSLQLGAERTGLIFRALEQIAAKQIVQLEELKLQLGDSLPGAVTIAARSMGMTTAAFRKAVAAGEIMANDFLPKFARQIKKELGVSAAQASEMARAHFNRFGNAMTELKDSTGDLINDGLIPLAKYFTPLIKNIASSLTYYRELEKVTGEVTNAIKALALSIGAILTAVIITSFIPAIKMAVINLTAFVITSYTTSGALGILTAALGAALTGIRAITAALLTNPYFLAVAGVVALTIALKKHLDIKGDELKAAQDAAMAARNEKRKFDESKGIIKDLAKEYDELKKKKILTKDETENLFKIEKDLNSFFPTFTESMKKHGSAVKGVAEEYRKLSLNIIDADIYTVQTQIKTLFEAERSRYTKNDKGTVAAWLDNRMKDLTNVLGFTDDSSKVLSKDFQNTLGKLQTQLKLLKLSKKDLLENAVDFTQEGTDTETAKQIAARKKAFGDEIKDIEQQLELKIAKNNYAEETIIELKQKANKEKLQAAQDYGNKESDIFAKADYGQAALKYKIEGFELKKQLIESTNNFELTKAEELARQKLTLFYRTKDEELNATRESEKIKLALLEKNSKNDYAAILSQKTKITKVEAQISANKREEEKKLLDRSLKNEDKKKEKILANTYLTNREILVLEINTINEKLKHLNEYLKDKKEITLDEERGLLDKIEDLQIEKERKEKERRKRDSNRNEYGGKYGTNLRDSFQETIDRMPDKSGWEKLWKDLANVVADALSTIEQKMTGSFANNIEAFLNTTKSAGQALKDFFEDLNQSIRRMVEETIAEMIKLYVIRPMLESVFSKIFGGVASRVGGGGLSGIFGGFFAEGGKPPIGLPSIVGERGPELFVPDSAGTIIPNKMLGGQASQPVYVYAPNIKTGADAREVFNVLEEHKNQFFGMISDGVSGSMNLRNSIKGVR